jgi:hypothetical protein
MSLMEPKGHGGQFVSSVFDSTQKWDIGQESQGGNPQVQTWCAFFQNGSCFVGRFASFDIYVRSVRASSGSPVEIQSAGQRA